MWSEHFFHRHNLLCELSEGIFSLTTFAISISVPFAILEDNDTFLHVLNRSFIAHA